MFQALATTFKVEEDLPVWNLDQATMLSGDVNGLISDISIRRDIDAMEQMFLRGIQWNISANISPEEDMKSLILETPVPQDEVKGLLAEADKGSYIIQKEEDHYIVEVKTGNDTFESHRFTFDDKGNPTEKLPEESTDTPKSGYDVNGLISQWGGKELVRKNP